MLNSTFIHTVDVKRRTLTGRDAYNAPVYSEAAVYSSQRCRVEQYAPTHGQEEQYNPSGQRVKKIMRIYFPNDVTIQSQDRVLAESVPSYSDGDEIGLVDSVDPAVLGTTNTVDHYEIRIEVT